MTDSIRARMAVTRPGTCKLDEPKVRRIKQRLAEGDARKDIARDYRVSTDAIGEIARGVRWGHVR